MINSVRMFRFTASVVTTGLLLISGCAIQQGQKAEPVLTQQEYFERPGVNLLAFNSVPGGMFFDAKTSGVEIIHHGERTATNGDVRLLPTPEQWDGTGQLVSRTVEHDKNRIVTRMHYPQWQFNYTVVATQQQDKFLVQVVLDDPLPKSLEGKAGFNLEFLPSVYWDKTFIADSRVGHFPRSASTPSGMLVAASGLTEPSPLAQGQSIVLAPEDPEHRIKLRSTKPGTLLKLYDGRTKAQNGWYVVRSLLPSEQRGVVVEWELDINSQENWLRPAVIAHSQVGYHPAQKKQAVIELDKNAQALKKMQLLKINDRGESEIAFEGQPDRWGQYLRYNYLTFDFTHIDEPGVYQLQYGEQKTHAFTIDENVFASIWQPTLDFFFPVQMDHMLVKEAYRTWHGLSHMDDALQAPPNYEHFDLFAHDENLDTPFKPFEHIPGLNYGGWYDAGDYDIRTQSQYQTVRQLVHVVEQFGVKRDNTTVDHAKKYVEINRPDGADDLLQQIEHGTLALLAQHRAIGHAIPGIVAGRLYQYPYLGDAASKTDNKIYSAKLDPHAKSRKVGAMYEPSTIDPTPTEDVMPETGTHSGRFDDRWAFTSNSSALNYGSAAALAAASRVLKSHNPELADESLNTALRVWAKEASREPNRYRFGNTTGGKLEDEKLKAAVELLLATGGAQYRDAVQQALTSADNSLNGFNLVPFMMAVPKMDASYKATLKTLALAQQDKLRDLALENPYGVPITRGGWAGNGSVMGHGILHYWLHRTFPQQFGKDTVYNSLHYLLGTHPDSNYSFVSGVGAQSQTNAYGTNRADFSFIPGGIVPGVLVLAPDYPENKSDWPFFWGQNEYVIPMGAHYLFLSHAVQMLLSAP
ncbi:MAG TPA: glycoside hydrolase family 9 protein [Marinagarivorans sp.]